MTEENLWYERWLAASKKAHEFKCELVAAQAEIDELRAALAQTKEPHILNDELRAHMLVLCDENDRLKAALAQGKPAGYFVAVRQSMLGEVTEWAQVSDKTKVPLYRQAQPAREPLHVGDSKFEDWYQSHEKASGGDKQLARDAYAAGMSDPLVQAQPAREPDAWIDANYLEEMKRRAKECGHSLSLVANTHMLTPNHVGLKLSKESK